MTSPARAASPNAAAHASSEREQAAARFAQCCKALGDDTRLRVIDMLSSGEHCVCDLQAHVDIPQPLLSFHLRVLRDAGIVTHRRAGRWAYYALNADAFAEMSNTLSALRERAESSCGTSCCEPTRIQRSVS